ncbi:site-specific DNA-methyltransferase [Dysosmobacter welbionis]|uniref:site-specific DNA-methyltransferase n=1 Tax=Dysosmobacter welbionis TaxID=2093857 RepID=UPI00307CA1D2
MPTLEWIGKDKVVNHHQEVPYRVLERQYSYDEAGQHTEDNGSENMIIHGDNLEALKALLPRYEGKVKCIYIDPPYNTGNEGWVYNDNVNDPKIKKWLGEVVGKEGEDLSRHDKWLCMMYPRLKLLQRLLAEDGAIFVSIDDTEIANLKLICNAIMGQGNHIATFVWQKRYSPDVRTAISDAHEFILCYARNPEYFKQSRHLLPLGESQTKQFSNPDKDPRGPWKANDFTAPGYRPNQMYEITLPSGRIVTPPKGRCWRVTKEGFEQFVADGRMIYGNNGDGVPAVKRFLSEMPGMVPWTWWGHEEVGHTQEGNKQLAAIMGKAVFDYPKPTRLIERIIQIASDPDSIILDSFAGSGTTAQAVLNMNKVDGGNRKFILVEMMDYADSITAERVKRVISGYKADKETVLYDEEITIKNLAQGAAMLDEAKAIAKEAKEKHSSVKSPKIEEGHLRVVAVDKAKDMVDGLGGNFSYYELGPVLLLPDGNLNEEVGPQKIREYVYYMETKEPLPAEQPTDEPYFMGLCRNTAYYFYYERESVTTLDHAFLATVQTKAEGYTIYADLCAIPQETLRRHNITFKKIPRDIARL